MSCEVLASTDVTGIGLRPDIFRKVYSEALYDELVQGAEMIGLRPTAPRIKGFERNGIKVAEIHGRTGIDRGTSTVVGRLMQRFMNSCMVPTRDLVDDPELSTTDILVHEPELRDSKNQQAIIVASKTSKDRNRRFWVENHVNGSRGIELSLGQIKNLISRGCDMALMIDPCHFLGPDNLQSDNFLDHWNKMCRYFRDFAAGFDQLGICSFSWGWHFPFGTSSWDALPVTDPDYLKEILDDTTALLNLKLTGQSATRLVFEYPRTGLDLAWPSKTSVNIATDRFGAIYDAGKRCGLMVI